MAMELHARPFDLGLPEGFYHPDTGCEASPSCLSCPLPMCKHDDPAWYHRYQRQQRDLQIIAWLSREPVKDVAARFGISPRSVQRAIQRTRSAA